MYNLQSSAWKTEVDLHVFNERSFIILLQWEELMGFPGGSDGKESAHNVGDLGLFDPWVRKIPGEGNSNSFQYSFLENSMNREAWWATVHGVTKSWT